MASTICSLCNKTILPDEPTARSHDDRLFHDDCYQDAISPSGWEDDILDLRDGTGKKLMPWHWLLKHGELDEVTLEAGSFISDRDIKDKWKHKYHPDSKEFQTISKSTLFWYPPDVYKVYPRTLYNGEQREIAGIFLKNVIPQSLRDEAQSGLNEMKWVNPKRKETATALKFQRDAGLTPPKELNIGRFRVAGKKGEKPRITLSDATKNNLEPLKKLDRLFNHITGIFATVLPLYFGLQNSPKSGVRTTPGQEDFGGIPAHLRYGGLSAFSGVAMLRSCPASVHKDQNARKDHTSFACLTSIGEGFSGGTFCLLEYGLKIPVKPGDVFIGQTTREWHYNTSPVDGVKYSLVCYFHKLLAKPTLKMKEQAESQEQEAPKEEH